MALSLTQRRALAIAPKFTGVLSMIGSATIIWDVLNNPKKRKHAHSRIMLAMSCFDFVTSCMYALSTWPIPSDGGGAGSTSPLYAAGTTRTCTFQGFFIQLSLASPLYNLCLATCHLLVIKYQWSDVRLARLERYFHPIIASITIGIATAGLFLKIFNNANVWCWIAPNPSDPDRGNNANTYRWAFYYVELWLTIILVTAIMMSVVSTVVNTERRMSRYSGGTTRSSTSGLAATVRTQAILYVSAFYITWTFPTTLRILQTIQVPVPYAIYLCAVIFTPLQGFFNSLIYLRPRYLKHREKKRREKRRQNIAQTVTRAYPSSYCEIDVEERLAEANRTDDEKESIQRVTIGDEPARDVEEGNDIGNIDHSSSSAASAGPTAPASSGPHYFTTMPPIASATEHIDKHDEQDVDVPTVVIDHVGHKSIVGSF